MSPPRQPVLIPGLTAAGPPACPTCERIVTHLNKRLGKRHKNQGAIGRKIHRCHRQASKDPEVGYDAAVSVINWLYDGWAGTEMAGYLVPMTIFRVTKFLERWESIQAGEQPPGKVKP